MRQGSQGKPDFADLLRQWRIYKNWTQEQMGEALSRSKRTITYWENGAITKIPINHVAHCLGITTAEFLAGPYPADKQIETETAPAKIRDLKLMELPENTVLLYMLSDLRESIIKSDFTGWALPKRIGVHGQVAVRVDVDTPAAKFGDLLLVAPYENQAVNGERIVAWDSRKEKATVIQASDLKPYMQVIGLVV